MTILLLGYLGAVQVHAMRRDLRNLGTFPVPVILQASDPILYSSPFYGIYLRSCASAIVTVCPSPRELSVDMTGHLILYLI